MQESIFVFRQNIPKFLSRYGEQYFCSIVSMPRSVLDNFDVSLLDNLDVL